MVLLLRLSVIFSFAIISNAEDDFKSRCLSFQPQRYFPNSTLTHLEYIPGGTNLTLPENVASCKRPSQVVWQDICRMALSLPTSNRSSVTFEGWFPRAWAGRFLATGNGGIDGCIKYEDLAYGSQYGFAAVGSNNGHNGTTGEAFWQNEDVVVDYAWRSLHTITAFGKKVARGFYDKEHTRSYYIGCSLGGRQGIKAAMDFPSDFDGIVAGAPAVDFNHMAAWRGSFFPKTGGPGDRRFITAEAWKGLIHDEVLRQCDMIDGAADAIIEDPTLCHFDPGVLLCEVETLPAANATTTCLNEEQVETVRQVLAPMRDADGEVLFPGMQPGNEIAASSGLYNGQPWPYSLDWFKYIIYDPSWDGTRMELEDILRADKLNPADIRTYPSQLSAYKARGGKILHHHGQQDNQITSFNSIRFWHRLHDGMSCDLDSFYRFFRISGMNHCSAGPGAWVFGQGGGASAAGIAFEGEGNILAALVDWVEKGRAPEVIVGTKFINDTVANGVSFRRRHCKYPLKNTFVGASPHDVDSWECRR